jgi:hypothetical protein
MSRNKCSPGSNITCFTFYIHLWPMYWLSRILKSHASRTSARVDVCKTIPWSSYGRIAESYCTGKRHAIWEPQVLLLSQTACLGINYRMLHVSVPRTALSPSQRLLAPPPPPHTHLIHWPHVSFFYYWWGGTDSESLGILIACNYWGCSFM